MPASLPTAAHPGHLCYTKTTWAASWVERPLLRCNNLSNQAAPGHASAQFHYRYGRALLPAIGNRSADSSVSTVPRGSLLGHYVKVVVTGVGTWYGVLTDIVDDRTGDLTGNYASGTEQYTAYGLTLLLEKSLPIRQTKVKTGSGTSVTIGVAIPVNGGSDGRPTRSRIAAANQDATDNVFTNSLTTAIPDTWTAQDFGDYLLDNFPPKDSAGTAQITFNLLGGTALNYKLPMFAYHGQNLWQILQRLIPRQRGLGFHAVVNGSDEVDIKVWSHSPTAISLPSGETIPANTDTTTYNVANAVNINNVTVTTSAIQTYDQVICVGERRGSVFSVDSTVLEPDWTQGVGTDEDDYNDGRTADSDWSSLSDSEKFKRNSDYRAEDHLTRVFSWWRFPVDWDGLSMSVTGAKKVFVAIDPDTGDPDEVADAMPHWAGELRIQSFVPLRQGVDYTGTITPATSEADDEEGEFLPLLAWWDKELGERMDAAADGDTDARTWSVQTRVRDDAPGLIFQVVGGQQHYLANDLYVSNGSFEDTPSEAQARNHDSWRATIYVLQPQHVEARYPADDDVTSGDVVRVLELMIPDAYLDYLVPTTTVAINHAADGTITYGTSSGGWVRDDRERLDDIARLAWQWYGTERKTLNLSFRGITAGFDIGTIVTELQAPSGNQTINTAITNVTYDLNGGTTSLQTHYNEIDFAALV